MSRKTQLATALRNYKTSYAELQQKLGTIEKSNDYTESGKERIRNDLLQTFEQSVTSARQTINSLVEDALKENNKSGFNPEAGYQAGLSNVLKMLELGAIKTESDLQSILTTYKGDYTALGSIRAILTNTDDPDKLNLSNLVPTDNRGKTKELLEKFQQNANTYIGSLSSDAGLGLDGMETFINDRLGDNLEVID